MGSLLLACSGSADDSGLNGAAPGGTVANGAAFPGDPPVGGAENPTGGAGDGPIGSLNCAPGLDVGASPLTRLSSSQFQNGVRRLFGVEIDVTNLSSADERGAAFIANLNVPVSDTVAEFYLSLAEKAAEGAAQQFDSLLGCPTIDAACAEQFITTYGSKAYRRPLTPEQVQSYMTVFAAGDTPETGVQLMIQAMLQSPHFIYRIEDTSADAGAVRALDDFELAARLALALQNSIPDDVLFAAASTGGLNTEEALRGQVERLLQTDETGAMLSDFHLQWLGLETLDELDKDPTLFPDFSDDLRLAMRNETARFADYVIRQDDARLDTLFNAPYAFLEGPLFEHYGLAEAAGDPAVPVQVDPAQRGGLLTQSGLLASNAYPDQGSPILRGILVRQNFLCQTLPAPPESVNSTPPTVSPEATTRERFAQHVADPSCAACHSLIDGVGLGFENYDAIGKFRTAENGAPIDASGQIVGLDGQDVTFNGVRELSQLLAASPSVQDCVTRQWFRYTLSRSESAQDACSTQAAYSTFQQSDFNIRELLTAIVTSESFRHVKGSSL